ncbi:unnamed protein product [marine sediment metagenome]|uniref:DUF998 domain-containing protein n=1 Tax=marine sediment metagenome TaxID=412755 RepID=X1BQ30_9ZZZZ
MSQLNSFLLKINRVFNAFLNEKLIKICIYVSLLIFLPGLLIGVVVAYFFGPESYNIIDNYISDLGSIRYTPAPFILDGIAMITACFLVPVFFYIAKMIVSDTKSIIFDSNKSIFKRIYCVNIDLLAFFGLLSLLSGAVGLFGVGLFSEDRTTELGLHYIFSIIIFAGLAFGAFLNGIAILIKLKRTIFPRLLGFYMMACPFVVTILFLFPPNPLTRPFLEWMMLIAAFLWLIPGSLFILKNFKSA